MSTHDKITSIVNDLLDGVHSISKSETIVGQPQAAGDAMVIPVHRLKVAFGAGSGSAGAHGARIGGDWGSEGAGGAVELDPVAAIAIGKDGHAHLLTVDADAGGAWTRLLQDVPDLVTRVAHALGERAALELRNRGVKPELAEVAAKPEALPEKK